MNYKFKGGFVARPKRRNRSMKMINYKTWLGEYCMNPNCESGLNIETHHINPVSKGGKDEYWNFILLCRKCHKGKGLHSDFESKKVDLFNWKCLSEMIYLGFVLDEQDDDYYDNIKKLVIRHRQNACV